MARLSKTSGLVMLSSLLAVSGAGLGHGATSNMVDILPNDIMGSPDKVEVGGLKPLVASKPIAAGSPASGNPLWAIPLSALTATRDRPIFSVSRRPPPRAVAGPRIEPVAAPAAPAPVIEHPALALIGAVVGDRDAIAVFQDRGTHAIVRLRQGETHAGWLLSSVLRREVTFTRDDRSEIMVLQRPDGPAAPGAAPAASQPIQAVSGTDGFSAPFIPRSTPKNGEADGL
jgi:general secretion pathway protein N